MSDLFNSLGNKNKQINPQQNANPDQMLQELKNDPSSFLKSRGFNVPDGVNMNNPQSIINGLMQSGQIGNNRFQQIMRLFGRRIPGK